MSSTEPPIGVSSGARTARRPPTVRMRSSRKVVTTVAILLTVAVTFTFGIRAFGSEGAAAQPRFTDVTSELGRAVAQWDGPDWDRTDLTPAQERERLRQDPATMSAGVAVIDVDRDGFDDVYVTRMWAPNLFYRNHNGETFVEQGAEMGIDDPGPTTGAVFGDVDGDGDLDLFVTSLFREPNRLFINDGTNNFTEEGIARGAAGPDDYLPGDNLSFGASMADIDSDGDLDIIVNQWHAPGDVAPGKSRILVNDGTGRFTTGNKALGIDFTELAVFTTVAADANGDGLVDLLVVGDWGTSRLYVGQQDGGFIDDTGPAGIGSEENGMGSVVADLDGDLDLDWFVTSISGPGHTGNRLFMNDGGGVFTDMTDAYGVRDGFWGWGTAAADFDNDGDLDLVMTNGWQGSKTHGSSGDRYQHYVDDPMRLWLNSGELPWDEIAVSAGLADTGEGKALVAFDYDRDGDLDLFIARTVEGPRLYRNDSEASANWLRILPVDSQTGAPVMGAVVYVTDATGRIQRRDVRAGDTFQGQRPPSAHFGFGPEDGPVTVRVEWPDGSTTTHSDVEQQQVVSVALSQGGSEDVTP